jgi:hypothetical protein
MEAVVEGAEVEEAVVARHHSLKLIVVMPVLLFITGVQPLVHASPAKLLYTDLRIDRPHFSQGRNGFVLKHLLCRENLRS